MVDLPPELTGYVKGQFAASVAEATSAGVQLTGRAILTPDPDWVRVLEAEAVTVLPSPLVLTLDPVTGNLEDAEGATPVGVLATNVGTTDPTGFTWRVRYEFDFGEASMEVPDFHIAVPQGNAAAAIDLAQAIPSAASDGTATAAGFTDDAVAALVTTPGTALREAILVLLSSGAAGSLEYIQAIPASEWIITHGYGRAPNVAVWIGDEEVFADLQIVNADTVRVEFPSPQAGKAVVS